MNYKMSAKADVLQHKMNWIHFQNWPWTSNTYSWFLCQDSLITFALCFVLVLFDELQEVFLQ